MRACFIVVVLLGLAVATTPARAQTSPAHGPLPTSAAEPTSQDQQLADYLALLQQISPAAEAAARTYLAAFRLRCGRTLDIAALRQALAQDSGDPVLMGLIRAAATQDAASRHRLVAQMSCPTKVQP